MDICRSDFVQSSFYDLLSEYSRQVSGDKNTKFRKGLDLAPSIFLPVLSSRDTDLLQKVVEDGVLTYQEFTTPIEKGGLGFHGSLWDQLVDDLDPFLSNYKKESLTKREFEKALSELCTKGNSPFKTSFSFTEDFKTFVRQVSHPWNVEVEDPKELSPYDKMIQDGVVTQDEFGRHLSDKLWAGFVEALPGSAKPEYLSAYQFKLAMNEYLRQDQPFLSTKHTQSILPSPFFPTKDKGKKIDL